MNLCTIHTYRPFATLLVTVLQLASTAMAGLVALHSAPLPPEISLSHTNIIASGSAKSVRNGINAQNEAFGQSILSTALNGDETDLNTLYLQTSKSGNSITIPPAGTHLIEVWIGQWDNANDSAGATIHQETFSVAGMTFANNSIYTFHFDSNFDIWNPEAPNQDYAFQVWWTSADNSHNLGWEIDTGQGFVDGAYISSSGTELTGLPFDDKATGNSDAYFAFASIPEPSACAFLVTGCLLLLTNRRNKPTRAIRQ